SARAGRRTERISSTPPRCCPRSLIAVQRCAHVQTNPIIGNQRGPLYRDQGRSGRRPRLTRPLYYGTRGIDGANFAETPAFAGTAEASTRDKSFGTDELAECRSGASRTLS